MVPTYKCPVRIWRFFERIDRELAENCSAKGCPHCGDPLHVATYPRSPRGLDPALMAVDHMRFSFCCGLCRRRTTPPCLRYFGRRVYGAWIFLRVAAADPKVMDRALSTFSEECGVPSLTLKRWRRWWRQDFTAHQAWAGLRTRLSGTIAKSALPKALLDQITALTVTGRLVRVLLLLLPWTVRDIEG